MLQFLLGTFSGIVLTLLAQRYIIPILDSLSNQYLSKGNIIIAENNIQSGKLHANFEAEYNLDYEMTDAEEVYDDGGDSYK